MNQQKKAFLSVREMSTIAVLAAVASILFLVEVPVVLFYKLDFSNLPVLLGTFAMGPLAGTMILFVKALIGLLHSTSQGVGELADFLVGMAMLFPAGVVYQRQKTRRGAVCGMALGTVCATMLAVLSNMYIMIPFYGAVYNLPAEAIVSMGRNVIPAVDSLWKFVFFITTPFNLLKWVILSVVGGLMYKPLSPILHGHWKKS